MLWAGRSLNRAGDDTVRPASRIFSMNSRSLRIPPLAVKHLRTTPTWLSRELPALVLFKGDGEFTARTVKVDPSFFSVVSAFSPRELHNSETAVMEPDGELGFLDHSDMR